MNDETKAVIAVVLFCAYVLVAGIVDLIKYNKKYKTRVKK